MPAHGSNISLSCALLMQLVNCLHAAVLFKMAVEIPGGS